MDYGHLKAEALTLKATDLILSPDSIAGKINKGEFKEQSGFVLNELSTEFLYTANEAYLKDLYLQTPGTELKRNALIRYASIESLQTDIGNLFLDLDIKESKLLVKDVLTFVPALRDQPAFADPNATWYINSRIKGRIADLRIDALQIAGLQDTKIDVSGRIGGLPSMNKLTADLAIRNLSSSKRDMDLFIPKNTLPSNITLPSRLNAKGNIKTISGQLYTDLSITTDLGNATIKGSFNEINDPKKTSYNARIETKELDLGTILQQKEMLGPVSATITTKGKGFDPKTASATFEGMVHTALIKQYNYRDLQVKGNISDQKANIEAGIKDPNIHFALNASADLSTDYPSLRIEGMIDSIKMQALHLTKDQMIYRGKIEGNFPVTNPDDLQGRLFLTQNLLVQNGKRFSLDTLELLAGRTDTGHYLRLNSNIMLASLEGNYKLTELGTIFQQAIQPYFAIAPTSSVMVSSPYDFTLNAYILDNPALKALVPGLEKIDSVSFQSHFSNQSGWTASLKAPALDMGPNKIRNLEMKAGTNQNALDIITTVKQFTSGKSIELDNTTITGRLANNTIDFTVNSKDKDLKDKYNIKGLFRQPQNGGYQFSLKPDSLILNYDTWNISANNQIDILQQGLNASNFTLAKNGQQLSINSLSTSANAPMEVKFDQFKLATLTGFVQTDSTLANGTLNGKIIFN